MLHKKRKKRGQAHLIPLLFLLYRYNLMFCKELQKQSFSNFPFDKMVRKKEQGSL